MVVLPFLVFAFFFALLSPSEGLVVEGLLVQREDGCSCLSFCAFCETHFRFFGWRRPAGAAAFFSKSMSPTSQLFFTGLPAVFFFFFFFSFFFRQGNHNNRAFVDLSQSTTTTTTTTTTVPTSSPYRRLTSQEAYEDTDYMHRQSKSLYNNNKKLVTKRER